ncbi:MAG: sodium/hydrogen exchanger [Rariglobus sp.]|nr:sodium/hydrogen exchanger [Rariglobus sp.]
MGLAHPWVKRAPFTPPMLYLLIGIVLGPWGAGVARIDPMEQAGWLLHGAEIAVIVSLFTVGMKLRIGPLDRRLRPALCLAFISMTLTVGLVAATGVKWLGLTWGAASLLGAVVAPTDPVLASDVQLKHAHDRDNVRLTLSAEAGLNDGTAFPFVILGLALVQGSPLGSFVWRWWSVDVLWAVCGGLAIGALLGYGLGHLLLRLTAKLGQTIAFGEYLVLGVIGVSYAIAVEVHTYGFLSVFAAGVALRSVERRASPQENVTVKTTVPTAAVGQINDDLATNPQTAPGYLAGVLLNINEQLDHLLEVTLVLVVGMTLASAGIAWEVVWFAPLLFLVIRPVAVLPLLAIRRFSRFEFGSVAWFGIRGIGSIYYLFYAIDEGLPEPLARQFVSLTMTLVAVSIIVHGVSVTPWVAFKDGEERKSIPQNG